jgi:hypothetical protein
MKVRGWQIHELGELAGIRLGKATLTVMDRGGFVEHLSPTK